MVRDGIGYVEEINARKFFASVVIWMRVQRQESGCSVELEVKFGMHHGSVLSPLLFPVGVDVVTELARYGGKSCCMLLI